MHVSSAIRIARAMQRDGFSHPTLTDFASLGGPQEDVRNGERDLHRWVHHRAQYLDIWNLKLDLQRPSSNKTEEAGVPCLLPFVLLHALWKADRWQKSCIGPGGIAGLRAFWKNAAGQPWFEEHPALRTADLDYTIPLVFHCDGAEVYSNSEFYIWSVSSLMAKRCHVLDNKFQVLKIPHESMRVPEVKAEVMRVVPMFIAWCCDICASGIMPPHDLYGKMANGFCHGKTSSRKCSIVRSLAFSLRRLESRFESPQGAQLSQPVISVYVHVR